MTVPGESTVVVVELLYQKVLAEVIHKLLSHAEGPG